MLRTVFETKTTCNVAEYYAAHGISFIEKMSERGFSSQKRKWAFWETGKIYTMESSSFAFGRMAKWSDVTVKPLIMSVDLSSNPC